MVDVLSIYIYVVLEDYTFNEHFLFIVASCVESCGYSI